MGRRTKADDAIQRIMETGIKSGNVIIIPGTKPILARKPRKNICAQAIAAELHRILKDAPRRGAYEAAKQLVRDRAVKVPECRDVFMVDREGTEHISWWDSDGKPGKRSVSAFKRYFYADGNSTVALKEVHFPCVPPNCHRRTR